MKYSIFATTLVSLAISSMGCGQGEVQPKAPVTSVQSSGDGQTENTSMVVLSEQDLTTNDGLGIPSWVMRMPDAEKLSKATKLKIISNDLARYSFDSVDMYVDSYDEHDSMRFPFVQVSEPSAVISKGIETKGETIVPFPGGEILGRLEIVKHFALRPSSDPDFRPAKSIKLRILLTDTTQEGNPVVVVLFGTLWVAP